MRYNLVFFEKTLLPQQAVTPLLSAQITTEATGSTYPTSWDAAGFQSGSLQRVINCYTNEGVEGIFGPGQIQATA